jgi:hypothetical protein
MTQDLLEYALLAVGFAVGFTGAALLLWCHIEETNP